MKTKTPTTKQMFSLMGKMVVVTKRLTRIVTYPENMNDLCYIAIWRSTPLKARTGWVVGRRVLQNGRVIQQDYGLSFNQKESVPCLLVCFWPNQKPIPVPMDGYKEAGPHDKPTSEASAEDGEQQKLDHMHFPQLYPRDEKGRFRKLKPEDLPDYEVAKDE